MLRLMNSPTRHLLDAGAAAKQPTHRRDDRVRRAPSILVRHRQDEAGQGRADRDGGGPCADKDRDRKA